MPKEYEIQVRMEIRKYYLIDADNRKEAIEKANEMMKSIQEKLDNDMQKLFGVSLDLDSMKFDITHEEWI